MQVVFDADDLQIAHEDIGSSVTVVAFAGAGRRIGGEPAPEFYKSLRAAAQPSRWPNIISVIDKKICWYNNNLTRRISNICIDLIAIHKSTKIIALGTSMGAHGAIICAHLIAGCRKVIAFGPHFSVDRSSTPFDTRSPLLRAQITSWDFLTATPALRPTIEYFLLYGREHTIDRMHAGLYLGEGLPNLNVRFIAGSKHNVAAYMRDHGVLYAWIDAMLWDDPEAARIALASLPRSLPPV